MAEKNKIDLSDFKCKGCGHHCPLSDPRCKKGKQARKSLLNGEDGGKYSKSSKRRKNAKHEHDITGKSSKHDGSSRKKAAKKLKKSAELGMMLSRLSDDEQRLLKHLLRKMLNDEEDGSAEKSQSGNED
ncbi:MAG: hypothetical protein PUA82_06020 [Eubacteriales bacterium]|nr:hypothetical protein [Eubacteriales bacterium]